MALPAQPATEPVPISVVAGRYLLFDTNAVTYLRSTYNICGVLIGSIPQIPQQNVFLGLPVELLPEEARLLVRKGAAYIVDATTWHQEKFSSLKGADRRMYLDSLRSEGRRAQQIAEENSRKRVARGLAKQALLKAAMESTPSTLTNEVSATETDIYKSEDAELLLFNSAGRTSPTPPAINTSASLYTVTTTATDTSLKLASGSPKLPDLPVPESYPLFAHLHALSYFITPGLRFGCDYTVYPGDPLRFHSHFLAVGYDWDEDIPLMDLIGGGRLGTGVKKGFLIGGKGPTESPEDKAGVRTFCIEWGGM
jgi:tRNA-splicing endonuclease subunit Sen34